MKISTAARIFRCLWAVILATALSACGGGGDSSTVPVTNQETVSTGLASLPGEIVPSTMGLIISPSYLDLLVFTDSNVYQRQTISILGSYVGDGVLIGFAPDVQAAPWLSFSQVVQGGQNNEFNLPMTLIPGSLTEGYYNTSLRFVSGFSSGGITGIVDLPIYLHVAVAPPVYSGDITLGGYLGKLTGVGRSIPLDFDGMVPDQVSTTLRSDMGPVDEWLIAENDWRTSMLNVRVKPNIKVGTYSGYIDVFYTIHGARGSRSIPFKIIVQADEPIATHVAPSYLYSQGSSVLVVRGHAFRKATSVDVRVGSMKADIATIVSDTEIRASFNSNLSQGNYIVQVLLDDKVTSPGEVVVINKPTYAKEDILPPCSTSSGRTVYDPRRGNIIGFCDDTFYVMGQHGGVWSLLATRKIDDIDYSGWFRSRHFLTADQKYIVVSGKAQIILLDPVTLQTADVRPIPVIWPDSAGYGYLWLEAVLNSGKIVLTISGIDRVYFVYDIDNQTLTRTQQSSGDAHIINANSSAALLSTLQLVYVKSVNLQSKTSSDPDLFTVTFFAAPESWSADYSLPPISPDGRKVAKYTFGRNNELFNLYDTTTITQFGTIANAKKYDAPVLRFTDSGDELLIVDGGQGRFDIYGAKVNDAGLKYSENFSPYSIYANLNDIYMTPDHGALILSGVGYGGGNASPPPPIKIIPLSR